MLSAAAGARAGRAVVVVGVAYAVVLAAGMVQYGLSVPIGDPILALMEVLTITSALPVLVQFGAFHVGTAPPGRGRSSLALGFAALFALTTIGVHVFELTIGRATGRHGLVWPSVTYAFELLAWDVLLGLALVFAAMALPNDDGSRRVRQWLLATGVCCLLGIIGPLVDNMRLQLIGVFGYAVLLPIAAWVWAGWFRAIGQARQQR
ncbi:MAG: hypothetical protein IT354_14145 [Gemmatimonadaceae bacterium]|nr:hypothetical protein [Gemmatimonadaceae bacterium]